MLNHWHQTIIYILFSAKTCGAQPVISHGFYEPSGFNIDDTAVINCNKDYRPVAGEAIVCQVDLTSPEKEARWSTPSSCIREYN